MPIEVWSSGTPAEEEEEEEEEVAGLGEEALEDGRGILRPLRE